MHWFCADGARAMRLSTRRGTGSSRVGPRRPGVDLTPGCRGQAGHTDLPNTRPHQSQCRKADASGHSSNLAVLTFAQCQFEPRRRNLCAKADRRIARPKVMRGSSMRRTPIGLSPESAQFRPSRLASAARRRLPLAPSRPRAYDGGPRWALSAPSSVNSSNPSLSVSRRLAGKCLRL
jgi:hypothetical protein